MISYGKQSINEEDLLEVMNTLKSSLLTTGPKVKEFESKFAEYVGSKYAIAVSNGTAALHLACLAIDLRKNDEAICSPMTFVASSNCVLYTGAKPVFVDINEQGLIDETLIESKITSNTKAIIPVHYSGLSANMKIIKSIADKHNLMVIEDACHALGAKHGETKIGDCTYSDMTIFSFHPVKHITTGEGGMITTNSKELYEKLMLLRTHGIEKNSENFINENEGPWYGEMQMLGFNYRITDVQCALGLSQLKRLDSFIESRRKIAQTYDLKFKEFSEFNVLQENKDQFNSYHLYVIKVKDKTVRLKLFNYLKENGIICQVHYVPVYKNPYYNNLGYSNNYPMAEKFYEQIISIPMYADLSDEEQNKVISLIESFYQNETMEK